MAILNHRSPGITAIYNAVKSNQKNSILDFGPCISKNLLFFSKLGCHFYFENFSDQIAYYPKKGAEHTYLTNFNELLDGVSSGKKFDVVLLWDLLNYLSLPDIVQVLNRIEAYLRPNTLVHTINYVGAKSPATPGRFELNDQYNVSVSFQEFEEAKRVRLTTADMLRSVPQFAILRSFLKREGMVSGLSEQIMCYQPHKQQCQRVAVFSSAEPSKADFDVERHIASPAISQLCSVDGKGARLLDLGVHNDVNNDGWKRIYSDVYSEDLNAALKRFAKLEFGQRKQLMPTSPFLAFEKNTRFDVIVAWDIFNYLDDELLFEVGRRLVDLARDGTKMIVMCYSGARIPARPQPFVLTKGKIGLAKNYIKKSEQRRFPALTSVKIQQAFPGFFVENTYAFRPGMERGLNEYVFVFKDAETQLLERQARAEHILAQKRELKRGSSVC